VNRKSAQLFVFGTTIIAMVLQMLVSSAHIHGLDGDKFHLVYAQSETSAPLTPHPVDSARYHGHEPDGEVHSHHLRHSSDLRKSHHDVGHGQEKGPFDQLSHVDHDQQPHSDGDHEPWHACDFSLLFGAFASLNIPVATALFKPSVDKAFIPLHAIECSYAVLKGRANCARAPPTIT
jgi:hypothetical protein